MSDYQNYTFGNSVKLSEIIASTPRAANLWASDWLFTVHVLTNMPISCTASTISAVTYSAPTLANANAQVL